MGVDITVAALAAGHVVVATGRSTEKVSGVLGEHEICSWSLDVTDPVSAAAAVQAAVDRFGRLDVLVNHAANFHAGFFEAPKPSGRRSRPRSSARST